MDAFTRISAQRAHEIIESSDVTIVDVRDADSFAQEHIPKANSLNDGNIDAFLADTDKEKPLICYCYRGISSQRAAAFFADRGFKKVYSIDGGWEDWKKIYA